MKNYKNMAIISIPLLILVAFVAKDALIDKVVDKVIQKIEKEYSPSPYGPVIDPDKLDVDKLSSKSPDKK